MTAMVHVNRASLAVCAALVITLCHPAFSHELPELSGAELFQHLCASCHGVTGRGAPAARGSRSRVPDLTRVAARHGGVFPKDQVRQTIEGQTASHGPHDMPSWSRELYAYEGEDAARRARVAELIGRLVDYLQSIQRK